LDLKFTEGSEEKDFEEVCSIFKIKGNEEFVSIVELKKALKIEFKYRELLEKLR
jgi:hypothetical protein